MKKLIIGTLLCLLGHSGFAADDVSDLVTKVKPAVVAIEIFDANSKLLGTPTGWLYNTGSSVEVVTNAHVVANCERIRMTTMGGINVRFDRWDGYDEIVIAGLLGLVVSFFLKPKDYL
jgi:S1-C subfamily serine protease